MPHNKALVDVNASCGTTAINDCADCHYGTGGIPTYEQDLYLSSGACGFCPDTCSSTVPPTEGELLVAARATTTDYHEELFKQFSQHLNAANQEYETPPGVIDPGAFRDVFPACPDIAPLVASEFSRTTGYLVRRVTTRTRNSRNIPDDWELVQLREFEEMAAKGKPRTEFEITKPNGDKLYPKEYEAFGIVKEGNGNEGEVYFRYIRSLTMPGLPTEPPHLPCLKCHGTFDQLAPGVPEALQDLYPNDLATGYKKGDIRGAWSVKIPLKDKH